MRGRPTCTSDVERSRQGIGDGETGEGRTQTAAIHVEVTGFAEPVDGSRVALQKIDAVPLTDPGEIDPVGGSQTQQERHERGW
jgi:hypothetical protein